MPFTEMGGPEEETSVGRGHKAPLRNDRRDLPGRAESERPALLVQRCHLSPMQPQVQTFTWH